MVLVRGTEQRLWQGGSRFGFWADGMPGGPNNPLGARTLYLYRSKCDTLYRIHGTDEPWTIGRAASGSIRLTNDDIVNLYERVPVGTPVLVLPVQDSSL